MQKSQITHGFTLLEMMVSIFILALVLVSVFRIHSATIRLSVAGKFYSTASHLARQKLADIEQQLCNPLSMSNQLSVIANQLSGDFGDAFPGYKWQCFITSLDRELSTSKIPESLIEKTNLQNLKQIAIEISYKDDLVFNVTSWKFLQNN